jgi:hypothetical protein
MLNRLLPSDRTARVSERFDATLIGGRHISDIVNDASSPSITREWLQLYGKNHVVPIPLPAGSTTRCKRSSLTFSLPLFASFDC